jgi:A/G-specific adenine glycosylase
MSGKKTIYPGHELDAVAFQRALIEWFRHHARKLPWRDTVDPYAIWLSETMLQQTRVAAVIDHYKDFLRRFPTLLSLALAPEPDVLAAWSGLGYYRRAKMLHKAAQFITEELGGVLPSNSVELRTLPGIGEYTAAAVASIAFGESAAVVDGNVARVLLRITGRAEESTASAKRFLRETAQGLMPLPLAASKRKARAHSGDRARLSNPPGDHNQAMMELGATICLPRAPLCLECPVYAMCRTRGEHTTPPRTKLRSREVAYLLALKKRGVVTHVLLALRPPEASLMPGMYELPPLPFDTHNAKNGDRIDDREPILRLRHAITNTNYYVRIFAPTGPMDKVLQRSVPLAPRDLHWVKTSSLGSLPLTGLARKVLARLDVMRLRSPTLPGEEERDVHAAAKPQTSAPVIDQAEDHDNF